MRAMLLAAGLGTRLKPLTDTVPKPLVQVAGLPLIYYHLALLKKNHIREIVINLHHLGAEIERALGDGRDFDLTFTYSYEKEILGTGGGILKAAHLFGEEPFIVLNADILIDIDVDSVIQTYKKSQALATLVVRDDPRAEQLGSVQVDPQGRVRAILNDPIDSCQPMLFTGMHVLSNRALTQLPQGQKCCIIRDGYIPLLQAGGPISAHLHTGYWNDLGTIERLHETEQDLLKIHDRLSFINQLNFIKNVRTQKFTSRV